MPFQRFSAFHMHENPLSTHICKLRRGGIPSCDGGNITGSDSVYDDYARARGEKLRVTPLQQCAPQLPTVDPHEVLCTFSPIATVTLFVM